MRSVAPALLTIFRWQLFRPRPPALSGQPRLSALSFPMAQQSRDVPAVAAEPLPCAAGRGEGRTPGGVAAGVARVLTVWPRRCPSPCHIASLITGSRRPKTRLTLAVESDRATSRASLGRVVRPRLSASPVDARTSEGSASFARSMSVRSTVITGISSRTRCSSSRRLPTWMCTPLRRPESAQGTVTWITAGIAEARPYAARCRSLQRCQARPTTWLRSFPRLDAPGS